MIATIRAELRKFFTTRMWWGMAIGVAVAAVPFAVTFALLAGFEFAPGQRSPGLDDPATVRGIYTSGLQIAYLLTLAIGVMMIGSEYRHKTITSTFLATPKRLRVMGAKVVALLVIGGFYGLISMLASVVSGGAVIVIKGFSPFPDASVLRTLVLGLLVLGLWALIGLGAGILIPNQIAALLIAVGVAWIVEPIAGLVLRFWDWGEQVAMYLPTSATQAMMATPSTGMDANPVQSLLWWQGSLVLVAYAAVMAIIGSILTNRRDIA